MAEMGSQVWRCVLPVIAAVALWLGGNQSVVAASLTFEAITSGDVTAGALHTDLINQGNDQVIDGSRMFAQANAFTNVGAADATAAATAGGVSRYGRIAGSAVAESDLGSAGNEANASAWFSGTFTDVLTIQSSVLAAGTPVAVRLGGLGHFLAQAANSPGSTGSFNMTYSTDQGALEFQHTLPPVAAEYKDVGYMDYISMVGGQIPIAGSLLVQANAYSNDVLFGNRTNYMNVDASSTALFSVEMLTPGTSYLSESGAVYLANLSAVPVPASLPLMASALAVLGFLRRRRKQPA